MPAGAVPSPAGPVPDPAGTPAGHGRPDGEFEGLAFALGINDAAEVADAVGKLRAGPILQRVSGSERELH